jgi:hypothetical protein
MTEAVTEPVEQEIVESTVENSGPETKTFSQEQVNKMVQERIQREKVASKKVQEEIIQERDSYKSAVESYEKFITKFVDEQKKEIPENLKALLNKLPLIEQYEYLTNPANKLAEKKQIPVTPAPTGKPQNNKNIFKSFI